MKADVPKVLIVDDEMDICYLLTGMFRNKNVPSKYANSLAEAQVLMQKDNPSILILDNHLPDGLGVQFLEYVKKYYPDTKIIMITAHDTQSDKNIALKKGADYFIGKPFSISAVKKTIDDLINHA